jgi:hypothetical protein
VTYSGAASIFSSSFLGSSLSLRTKLIICGKARASTFDSLRISSALSIRSTYRCGSGISISSASLGIL